MNFIQVFSNFSVENCYTIGSRADIKRLNQRIENGFNTEKQSLQVAFGDVLEGSVFDQCASSLTVPSMSKATAALHPVYNRDMRMYEQFCLVQDLVIEDLFKREVEQFTLVKDHVTTTIIIKSGYTYTEGIVSTKEKTDKDYTEEEMETGVFAEPNFVKYYLYASAARNSISSTYSWLFTALENNPRTESMVDITKYMLYKATEDDFGITNIDFNAYNESDFKDAMDFNPSDSNGNSDGNSSGGNGDALGQVELDGSYTVNEISLSNPIIDPISFVGSYSGHGAVDINPTQNGGTPVYAAAAGIVATATYHSSYGNYVLIDHGNGVSTLYAHAQSLVVTAGQSVEKGQLIMYEGSTGVSSAPHVHFEIRINDLRNQSLAEDMFIQLGFSIEYNY